MQTIFQMFIISKIHQGQIFIHIPVYLINFGRAVNDLRYDAETGDYANGHRLVSSPITAVEDRKYHTANTAYHQEDMKNYPNKYQHLYKYNTHHVWEDLSICKV